MVMNVLPGTQRQHLASKYFHTNPTSWLIANGMFYTVLKGNKQWPLNFWQASWCKACKLLTNIIVSLWCKAIANGDGMFNNVTLTSVNLEAEAMCKVYTGQCCLWAPCKAFHWLLTRLYNNSLLGPYLHLVCVLIYHGRCCHFSGIQALHQSHCFMQSW